MRTKHVGFFSPINGKHHPEEALYWLKKTVQWYFDFGQNAFKVRNITLKNRSIPVAEDRKKRNAFLLACKVAFVVMSWFTLIAPFIMITSFGIYKSLNNFILINTKSKLISRPNIKLQESESEKVKKCDTELLNGIFSQESVSKRVEKNRKELALFSNIKILDNITNVKSIDFLANIKSLDFLANNFYQTELLKHFLKKLKLNRCHNEPAYLQEAIDQLLKIRKRFRETIVDHLQGKISTLRNFLSDRESHIKTYLNSEKISSDLIEDYVKAIEILRVIDGEDLDLKKYFDEKVYNQVMSFIEPRGIRNIGSSCYMNSGLQVLIGIPYFRDLIINPWVFSQENESKIEGQLSRDHQIFNETVHRYQGIKGAFQEFLEAYLGKKELVEPANDFRDSLFNADLIDGRKESVQDAEIFFRELISAAGYFVLSKRYLFSGCNTNRKEFQAEKHAFQTVSMKSEEGGLFTHSFQEMIQREFSEKNLCKKDPYLEEGFDKEAYKYEEAAEYLILVLNRFGNKLQKHNEEVFFEDGEVIDFSCAMSQAVIPHGNFLYEVIAIIQHHGNTIKGGHFTADIKKFGVWFHCNDSKIESLGAVNPNLGHGYIFCFKKLPNSS